MVKEMRALAQGKRIDVKVEFVTKPVIKILNSNGSIDCDHVLVPIKFSKDIKEFSKEVHLAFNHHFTSFVFAIVVEDEDGQGVHSISCHASKLTAKK